MAIPEALTTRQLADLLGASPLDVIKALMKSGLMVTINQVIDYQSAAVAALELGFTPSQETSPTAALVERLRSLRPGGEVEAPSAQPRPPVVTVMGHVDHGKTSLLDVIRRSNVTAREVGGITQHIGAYQVEANGHRITFLDTPGHAAFTAMRARGAQVTDIAVLVVAADDGVMPQTIEAIDHARAAGVPMVVALNKIDKPEANLELVKRQLGEQGLVLEEWGGEVICVPVSAKEKMGIEELLENILAVAEVSELRANPNGPALGVVIEAELDKNRGPTATVLVQQGTLKGGDLVVVGETWGRVKAMFDERGQGLKAAAPSTPVRLLGLNAVPQAGDLLEAVQEERIARATAEERREAREQKAQERPRVLSLEDLYTQIQAGRLRELNLVLKTDVQGSIEPIKTSLEKLSTGQVRINVIHVASGTITESNVLLAAASKGLVLGFNTKPEPGARRLAESEGVDMRLYEVIYHLVEDMEKALQGLLEPVYVEVREGRAEVRQVFPLGRGGQVAGAFATEGKISRGASARVLRGETTLHSSRVASLRRFKDDVREVGQGYECGIGIEGFSAFQVGDVIECYRKERAS